MKFWLDLSLNISVELLRPYPAQYSFNCSCRFVAICYRLLAI